MNQLYIEKKNKERGGKVGEKRARAAGDGGSVGRQGLLDAEGRKEVAVALTLLIKHDVVKVIYDQK